MLNRYHENDAANSRAWGRALSGAIELALAEIERIQPADPATACGLAEYILEHCSGQDAQLDGAALEAGALEGSPRYASAQRAWLASRARAQQVAA